MNEQRMGTVQFHSQLQPSFREWLMHMECEAISWACWRYHDDPDHESMLCMGGEL